MPMTKARNQDPPGFVRSTCVDLDPAIIEPQRLRRDEVDPVLRAVGDALGCVELERGQFGVIAVS